VRVEIETNFKSFKLIIGVVMNLRRDGFINGNGAVKKKGSLSNSFYNVHINGLTNGGGKDGLINGNSKSKNVAKNGKKKTKNSKSGRMKIWAVLGLILLLIFGVFAVSTNMLKSTNWNTIEKYEDYDLTPVGDDNININKFAFHISEGVFEFYLQFYGDFMHTPYHLNFAYIFIDNDSKESTGYDAGYLGADYMVRLVGNNGTVRGTLLKFAGFNNREWNWTPIGASVIHTNGDHIITGSINFHISPDARLIILAQSGYYQDITPVVKVGKKALIVAQKPIENGTFEIKIVPLLNNVHVNYISIQKPSWILIKNAYSDTYPINRDISNPIVLYFTPVNKTKGLAHIKVESISTNAIYTIWGQDYKHYFGKAKNIIIDGCFDDWNTLAKMKEDLPTDDVENSNINILYHSSYNKDGIFFYTSVRGSMLNGNIAPEMESFSTHHWSNVTPLPKTPGSPYDYAEIDFTTQEHGQHRIVVAGYMGKVVSVKLDGRETKDVHVAVGVNHNMGAIEIGMNYSWKIKRYRVKMTDWNGAVDVADNPMRVVNVRSSSGWVLVGQSEVSGGNGADLDKYYLGWDDNNLYLNLTTHNTASWNVAYGFAIDVDQNSDSGYKYEKTGDAWGRHIDFNNSDPYLPDYEVYIWWSDTDGKITSDDLCAWDGSNWKYTKLSEAGINNISKGDSSTGLQWINITIPWNSIGGKPTTGKIATMAWVAGGDGSSAVDTVPYDSSVPSGDSWTDWDSFGSMTVESVPEFSLPYAMPIILFVAISVMLRKSKK